MEDPIQDNPPGRPFPVQPERSEPPLEREPLRFHGDGTEYFRIWIVNLVLTILTLGIYSAWAKVRTKRYFYGNTELKGDRFEYLADPVMILKGRIIAVAALVLYSLAQAMSPALTGILLLLFLGVLPFVIVRALRFNAIMSAWRGIRFGFDGQPLQAMFAYMLWPLFGLVTLGFGMPYAWYKQNQFVVGNYRFGTSPARSTAAPSEFFVILFAIVGIGVAGSVIAAFIAGFGALAAGGSDPGGLAVVVGIAGYFLVYLGIYVGYQALHFRVVYNNILVGENRSGNAVTLWGWFQIVLVNVVLMVLTLGVYYPWARVRLTGYMVNNVWIDARDLDSFVAHERESEGALGEEIGEAFDLGIGV